MRALLVLYEEPYNPYANLALEEALLAYADCRSTLLLRIWRNALAVVVGRTWKPWSGVNPRSLRERGIPLVRRISGGGPVYHDMGNLNYTVVATVKPGGFGAVEYAYSVLLRVVVEALRILGLSPRVANTSDVVVKGFKVSGNAAAATRKAVLLHGTLLIDSDLETLYEVIPPPSGTPAGVEPVKHRVGNLHGLAGGVGLDDAVSALIDGFRRVFGVEPEPWIPDPAVLRAARALESKYRSPSWTLSGRREPKLEKQVRSLVCGSS